MALVLWCAFSSCASVLAEMLLAFRSYCCLQADLNRAYVQQVSPEGDGMGYVAASAVYAHAPNYPNAQHISISPVGMPTQQASPEILLQLPYASYVVGPNHAGSNIVSAENGIAVSHPA
jgi:hypothetical protein